MSEYDERAGAGLGGERPTAAVLAAVPANDPVSASEVAAELDVERSVARDALLALSGDADLSHRQVTGRVGAVDVWYRPHDEEEVPLEERVDDAIDEMAVPGASELMQDWRRDAVREAFEFLRTAERAESAAVVDVVYPTHEAGFDSSEDWWGMVAPRLARLPGVSAGNDGVEWQFDRDA